jgi:hypothetical protein
MIKGRGGKGWEGKGKEGKGKEGKEGEGGMGWGEPSPENKSWLRPWLLCNNSTTCCEEG